MKEWLKKLFHIPNIDDIIREELDNDGPYFKGLADDRFAGYTSCRNSHYYRACPDGDCVLWVCSRCGHTRNASGSYTVIDVTFIYPPRIDKEGEE